MTTDFKVAHIVHHMRIGGVENAVRYHSRNTKLNYKVFCLGGACEEFIGSCPEGGVIYKRRDEMWLKYLYRLIMALRSYSPDLLVSSLWRSHLFCFIYRLFNKKKWAAFFHSAATFHKLDYLSMRLALSSCNEILCDSKGTLDFLLAFDDKASAHIISFQFKRDASISLKWEDRKDRAIFLGRLSDVKNLAYLIDLFAFLNKNYELAIDIYGEGDERPRLEKQIESMGLEHVINLKGQVSPDDVDSLLSTYKYYFQTSKCEGRAISVGQAMASGCCCFISYVGDISNYAQENINSYEIKLNGAELASKLVLKQIKNTSACRDVASRAQKQALISNDYSRSFDAACRAIVCVDNHP